ncbi:dynamin-related protein 4C-like isoform X2 [Primulina tabacum]|uniref:dynamin-related protein 4C-like isoform X2 n=1 Tax=Primulina tabacum TaxID=48773 RepID=UPI003F59A9F0
MSTLQVKSVCSKISSSAIDTVQRMSGLTITGGPLVSCYNYRIRPLLDVFDKLRNLNIMQEDIQLPTIVVVGDHSSGKSSVLESLAGISLPRGQGICTRVPLILRLENYSHPRPEFFLEFDGKVINTDEERISDDITAATDEIAGKGKGVSKIPLTLIVKKNGVPDLTMVDLPGITRVAVHGQPEDIYEQISKIIMEFITPEESVILNVLSASVDFTTCESIRLSQKVDKNGERTLAVVTKADKNPEGLLEKVTANDVNIGLGYVCVRNRIGDESYEEARDEEARLFKDHHLLSGISKSMVGIPVLAQKLVQIQASIVGKCLPDIFRKINDKLSTNINEMNKLPKSLSSVAEATTAFMHVLGCVKESLRKIMQIGEFEEYPDVMEMHCTARIAEMLDQYSAELQANCPETDPEGMFLLNEINVLEETKGIGLPNFLPRAAFHALLQRKIKGIYSTPFGFVDKVWNLIAHVVVRVLTHQCDKYPQILPSTRRAAQTLVGKKKQQSIDWVMDIVEMEKLTAYTCNPEYTTAWNQLMSNRGKLMEAVNGRSLFSTVNIIGFGVVDVAHLQSKVGVVEEAFDLKMRMTAYWRIVLRRLVDCMALHLLFGIQNFLNKDMEREIIHGLVGPEGNGLMERMLDESPSVAKTRMRLKNSIKLLKESKDAAANIMDRIASTCE